MHVVGKASTELRRLKRSCTLGFRSVMARRLPAVVLAGGYVVKERSDIAKLPLLLRKPVRKGITKGAAHDF